MKDKLSIKVSIAGRIYPVTIERTEEENVRKAVKTINEKVSEYEKTFGQKDRQDLLAMSSLFFASQSVELQNVSHREDKAILERFEKIDKAISAELVKE
ncbi:MAG: cell division protein ZapA [Bacteroidetes bacterium]|nr:cell division protein ZapA [Bacteroidota bacterium]